MATELLDLRHGTTRAEIAGPTLGTSVIFVPGMTYPYEVFNPLFEAVAQAGFRCIRYDLYGRGGSTYDGTALTLDALAEQIDDVRSALGHPSPTHIISLSNSDLLTLRWIRRCPDQARGLVWLSPTGFDRRNMNWQRRTLARLPIVKRLFAQRIQSVARNRMQQHREDLPPLAQDGVGQVYETAIRSVQENPHFSRAVASHIAHLPTDSTVHADLEHLAARNTAVMACRFGQERDVSHTGTLAFLNRLPACQLLDLPEGNHMGLLDQADALRPHLLRFLQDAQAR